MEDSFRWTEANTYPNEELVEVPNAKILPGLPGSLSPIPAANDKNDI